MVDTKPNRSISDQTIYSTRNYGDGDLVVKKYSDIYDKKFYHLAQDIMNGDKEKYLMYRNDPRTFAKIEEIVRHYYDMFKDDKEYVKIDSKGKYTFSFNPLYELYEETGEYVTKFSKNKQAPIIKSLKYTDGKLGSHIDISHKYKLNGKKVVLQQISPYRTDFYNDDGIYKFVTVRYSNIRYESSIHKFVIDEQWYEKEKQKRKISNAADFMFSMHHNEIIKVRQNNNTELYKYTATNSDAKNIIEVKPIHYYDNERIKISVGKKTNLLVKMYVDILGNMYESNNNELKLIF